VSLFSYSQCFILVAASGTSTSFHTKARMQKVGLRFLISKFRRILNLVYFLVGSETSENPNLTPGENPKERDGVKVVWFTSYVCHIFF
jgi:hypothetical protein